MRFKRVAAAFNDVAKARLCESSSSEHSSAESVTDLYVLVNSFMEKGNDDFGDEEEIINEGNGSNINCFDELEIKDKLRKLLGFEENDDDVKRNIHAVVENAWLEMGDQSQPDFKRRLMTRLRDTGFDAGVCKSKWERNGQHTAGNHEYIDVNVDRNRYIVEVYLAREFEIARPTPCYSSLVEIFPSIFVGKIEELQQVVRIMSRGMKKSMKKMDIHVPPWRRLSYMQAKWFSSYKRRVSEELDHIDDHNNKKFEYSYEGLAKKRAVGFVSMPITVSFNGVTIGNLAAALNG